VVTAHRFHLVGDVSLDFSRYKRERWKPLWS
jgi:hypothetical protein